MKGLRLVVLSGPSGAGKSTAINALEDIGFFCVDNMPVALWLKFMDLLDQSGEIAKAAVVVDVREREFLKAFEPVFDEIKGSGHTVELLYLDASDEALVRRFSETRRRHPLAGSEGPAEGIARERALLGKVRSRADRIIDTTTLNVHQLREVIGDHFSEQASRGKMAVNLISFGYRHGIPSDADLVFDVRFLPNPYFVESLKGLDGRQREVKDFVLPKKETRGFLKRLGSLLDYLLPLYRKEGKSYLTIAVGCTGGRHRSVAIVEDLGERLSGGHCVIRKRHRDLIRS